ncbi:MAG: hypothetical protein ACI35P_10825 [Bacillus sp. (in: firmicutes)]
MNTFLVYDKNSNFLGTAGFPCIDCAVEAVKSRFPSGEYVIVEQTVDGNTKTHLKF